MTMRPVGMILDCTDPERLASFWTELLDWQVTFRRGPYVAISRTDDFDDASWLFQRVAEPKSGKNRWHPDFRVTGDFEATINRIESSGGKRVPGYRDGGFLVMCDPEGNEFCLIPDGVSIEMDDDGNAHYLDGNLAHLKEA